MANGSQYVVVALGDSIVKGSGASRPENAWVGILEGLLRTFMDRPLRLVNRGVGDNVVSPRTRNYSISARPSALERLGRDVIAERPNLALVCLGFNDMRFGTHIEVFIEELEKIIVQLREELPGVSILLTNVYHMTGFDLYEPRNQGSPELTRVYNRHIEQLAADQVCMFADVAEAMGYRDMLVCDDGVHANDLGHRIIAHRVFETLAQSLDIFKGTA